MNKILERQLEKYFGGLEKVPKDLTRLFQIVSDTYDHAEEDRLLAERSLDLSSKELMEKASLLTATLNSTVDGILVVDSQGKITSFNERFVKMWGIPEDIIKTKDDKKAIEFVVNQLKDPDSFLKKVKELYNQPEAVSYDILEFKDGKIFERYSQPQKIGDRGSIGRVWSFLDVTEKKKEEQKDAERVAELESMNKMMIDRELKMIELKQKNTELMAKLSGGIINKT